MIDHATVDTNILVYALDASAGPKHHISRGLVNRLAVRRFKVPLQALNELFFVCTKKKFVPLSVAESFNQTLLSLSRVVLVSSEDLLLAMDRNQRDGIQFFDALLMATASRVGCTVFFSEDMQHGRTYDGLTVMNPFKMTAQELDEVLR